MLLRECPSYTKRSTSTVAARCIDNMKLWLHNINGTSCTLHCTLPHGGIMSFRAVQATEEEFTKALPGDDVVPDAAVQLDRAMTFPVAAVLLGLWVLQIGRLDRGRAGWYLPIWLERLLPRKARALRHLDPSIQTNEGDWIHDWASFGRDVMVKIEAVDSARYVVFTGSRGNTSWSWTLAWSPEGDGKSRLHARMRISAFRHTRLLRFMDFCDRLLYVAFFRGLTERL